MESRKTVSSMILTKEIILAPPDLPLFLEAIAVRENNANIFHYVYTDHLGSIVALTNNIGTITSEQNFDAWGRKRNPTNWTYASIPSVQTWLTRGYTGHEHLNQFGLINMNGRMYDPVVGRMLSTDNYVQIPNFTQSYNRYSYALNNPLKYNDPDGEWAHLVIGAVIGGTLNWLANGAEFNMKGLGHFGIGALEGALAAGTGAGVSAALAGNVGAGGGFAAGFIGTNTIASTGFAAGFVSGAAGGATNGLITGTGNGMLKGQSFGDAFTSGGVDQAWKQGLSGGVAGGIAGGIDALKNDRNFWTGAKQQAIKIRINDLGGTEMHAYDKQNTSLSELDEDQNWVTNASNRKNVKLSNDADGNYLIEVKTSNQVNKITNGGLNKDAGLYPGYPKYPTNNSMIIKSVDPITKIRILGYRYESNPIRRIGDLFHWR